MKKSMFLLACASSLALFADVTPLNAVDFEGYTAGMAVVSGTGGLNDSGVDKGSGASYFCYAAASESTDGSTVKAFEGKPTYSGVEFGKNYLELSTEGGTLWRSINATVADEATNAFVPGDAETVPSGGLYIDTMVQFTPTEDGGTPDLAADDKLAVWLNVDSDTGATNLCVRGTSIDSSMTGVATTFKLEPVSGTLDVQASTWYRLTVKATTVFDYSGVGSVHGFQILLDGAALKTTTATIDSTIVAFLKSAGVLSDATEALISSNQIVPSLKGFEAAGAAFALSAVGFKGSGAIDNLTITTEDPTPAPAKDVEFTITTATGVTAEWSTDGETWTAYAAGAKAPAGDLYIRLTNADGAVKTLAKASLSDDSKAFDESAETFSWTEYLGAAIATDTYGVDTAAEIVMFQKGVAAGLATVGVTFQQTADIDMAESGAFAGVGGLKGATPFAGVYDGNGKTISNVTFKHDATYRGFFNSVNNATIQNLTINVAGFDSTAAEEFGAAAFVGQSAGTTVLSGLTATGSLGTSAAPCNHSCAGILVRGLGTIQNCTNAMAIVSRSDNTKVGGIVALLNGATTITGCVNTGTLTAGKGSGTSDYVEGVGGIVGYNQYVLTIDNCSNTGMIVDEANTGRAGELIGRANAAVTSTTVNKGLADKAYCGLPSVAPTGFELRYTADGVAEWYPAAQMSALVMAKADATTGIVPGTVYSYTDKCTMTGLAVDATSMTAGTITADEDSTATTESLTTELSTYLTGHKLVQTATSPNTWTVDWLKYSGGAGTAADPYRIARVKDLVELGEAVAATNTADQTAYYKQTADIALTDVWTGIGAFDAKDNLGTSATYIAGAFQGTYDGGNYTISNVILKRGDYVGFFGSTYGATIKNLKISLGSATGFSETSTSTDTMTNYGGAAFVGVSVNTTIENCQTLKTDTYTTLKGSKAIGGIVGYAAKGTTVKGCVNNLNLETANEKCGGMMSIAQNTGNWSFADVVIDSCTNNGNLYCSTASKMRVGGLCSYSDIKVIFKGANVVTGTLSQNSGSAYSVASPNSGSVELAEGATFTVPAANMTINSGKGVDGLFFATVDGTTATLVKNAAVVSGGSYKVMAAGAPAITLANVGDAITLDTTLATATVTTSAENAEVQQSGNVYTVVSKGNVYPTYITDDTAKAKFDAWAATNNVTTAEARTGASQDAYLLNCAPVEATIAAAKDAFKITSITVNSDGSVTVTPATGDAYGNGTIEIQGATTLSGPWAKDTAGAKFFKAVLK